MNSTFRPKIWTTLGVVTAAVAVAAASQNASAGAGPAAAIQMVASGGEGGEGGGEGGEGGAVSSYLLDSKDPAQYVYDATAQVDGYLGLVRDSYSASAASARNLQSAVDRFLGNPTAESLASARAAWIAARPAYLGTEAFRFYDGPIEKIESRINAWPLNEGFIDYVQGNARSGLINDASKPVTLAALNKLDQASDESDVTTGWHAIEFLLWGQDLSTTGPGNRPHADYIAGTGVNDRRRTYLKLVTDQLVVDLESLAKAWDPSSGGSFARKLKAMPPREVIGRAINGMAILAGHELMSERLAVALDSGDQEDEHSCFSDTTHQDFVYNLKGIYAVWTGQGPTAKYAGLDMLVGARDAKLRAEVDALFATAEAKISQLGNPWDQVLAAPAGSPPRQKAEAAVKALKALSDGIKRAGNNLGVLVVVPTSSSH